MRAPSIQAIVALALLPTPGVHARTADIDLARVSVTGVTVEGLHMRIDGSSRVALSVDRLDAARLGEPGRLDWTCELHAENDGGMRCAGPATLESKSALHSADVSIHTTNAGVHVALAFPGTIVEFALPFDAGAPLHVQAKGLHAAIPWRLAGGAPAGATPAGSVDFDAHIERDGGITGDFGLHGLSIGSADGTASARALEAKGHASFAGGTSRRAVIVATLTGGRLDAGAVGIDVGPQPIEAELDATLVDDGIEVARFGWRDQGTLSLEASGLFQPAAMAPLRRLDVGRANLSFPQLRRRYAGKLFEANGLAALDLRGTLQASVSWNERGLQQLQLQTGALDVRDPARGIRIDHLAGGIDWRRAGSGETREIGWRRLVAGSFAVGPAGTRWRVVDGSLQQQSAMSVGIGGGRLQLDGAMVDLAAARAQTRFKAIGIDYESGDGTTAVAGLDVAGTVALGLAGANRHVRVDARVGGGEVLYGSTYAKLPTGRVDLRVDATFGQHDWRIQRFEWSDPGVLELLASSEIELPASVRSLDLQVRKADLAVALPRYAAGWLATRGYPDLSASGSLSGRLQMDSGGLHRFTLAADRVAVRDGASRFGVTGLDGSLSWAAQGDETPTSVGWDSLELLGISFGPARGAFVARAGSLDLRDAIEVDVLGGRLRLERFSAQPRSPQGERYAAAFALLGLQMPRLSAAFGWPEFPGNLSGGVPEVELVGDRIEFHGGLDLYVFDGHLGISGLSLERPFGIAPALQADVHFENLELEQLTHAFSFGGMSGRLFGTIDGLRLVDWSPVRFDAWLRTNGGGRMSYKAVDDLTSLGGGSGLGSGLQAMALKVFDTFGYRRLGLRCHLENEICAMAGIEPAMHPGDSASTGYTIVEGSGLPRIMIVGHRRRVDWPTLVRRLVEATRGQGPVIE